MGVGYQLKLENFEGPLDLLLHLIDENKMSIYDIKISIITEQYLDYLMAMQQLDMDIASDFLVIAATLLHIKSRSMLPKAKEDEVDSETDLIRQLIEYKKIKKAGERFKELHEEGQKSLHSFASTEDFGESEKTYTLCKSMLVMIYRETMQRRIDKTNLKAENIKEIVKKEKISLIKSIRKIIDVLFKEKRISFFSRFKDHSVSNAQLVTDFLSILVLSSQKKATLKQKKAFEDIIVEGTETLSYPDNIQEIYDWE